MSAQGALHQMSATVPTSIDKVAVPHNGPVMRVCSMKGVRIRREQRQRSIIPQRSRKRPHMNPPAQASGHLNAPAQASHLP